MSKLANGIESVHGAAAAMSAHVGERADPALVRADRVEQLYRQLPLGLAATVVIGVIAAIELHDGRLIERVLCWAGLLTVVVVLHAVLYLGYRNDAHRSAHAAQWLRRLGIGAFAAGAGWGFAAAGGFPSHADGRPGFLPFFPAGGISGGIPMYAAPWPPFPPDGRGTPRPPPSLLVRF